MKIKVILLLVLVCRSSCKQEKKGSEVPTQMEEVMIIHDEVMPKMGKLSKLVSELKEKIDTTATGKEYAAAMKDLKDSNKSMMDWMMGFSDRFNPDEILEGKELSLEKKEWLNEEEVKVKALKEQINSSIEKAEALLDK